MGYRTLNQRRYADAEPLYKRALTINKKALGSEHPGVATNLNNLAGLYDNQGRYTEAEPLCDPSQPVLKMSAMEQEEHFVRLAEIVEYYHK